MSTLKKDHVVGAGGSALAGGVIGGAAGGLVAGVPGLAVGAVAGTALGAVVGQKVAEAGDKRGDLGHFEQIHQSMPYYVQGMAWDDYAPAYRLGLDSYPTRGATPMAEAREALQAEWAQVRGGSRLSWLQAEPAVEHAWSELDKSLGGKQG